MIGKLAAASALLISFVNAHAFLETVNVGGTTYAKTDDNTPIWAWSPNNGPAATVEDLSTNNIACHANAEKATNAASVPAGGNVGFGWGKGLHKWGPFLTYAAKCDVGCDPNAAEWYKIGQINIDESGTWPVPKYVDAGDDVPVTLPSSMESGTWLLRTENINLGAIPAEIYAGCVSVEVTGGGSGLQGETVSFPGAYTGEEPGLTKQPYSVEGPADYNNLPGPAVAQ
ncbi:hypothetical protein E3P89_01740 [Wallemia ichthyophaga]|uniref:lytic cellulose monooxygenase (C4-dehydrogenating) n=1 Tax=Wallemia ichthyophaga TaxID=245174 RepID=A0A4T0GDU0_WALIC|nr:hypothetical protein E3P91_01445 [Wallemia ichthyophaga]TIA81508.1 hypothetical protein E3P98_01976 [Wallemia ichthyophaga]TIA96152.1 hypothetical protein E3P95_03386 [Wallemia ichthyophaga]TIA97236.1 hypothetical protein E3P94_03394 [Wallemia ichthyophaga]TIA98824.1 hypothetical protein E3P96_03065 [Wallemia ichthyophaga]